MTFILIAFFGLLGLGIIVFVHETGHFVAAKLSGVEVETFSLGWGKKLIGFKYRGTNYQLAWFPIGGYCKMKGEMQTPEQMDDESFHRMLNESGTYLATPWWKKVLISFAGPFANVIFAILIFALVGMIGYNYLAADNKIVIIDNGRETPAIAAGLQSGDRIIQIEDKEITNFIEMSEIIRRHPDKPLDMVVRRDDRLIQLTVVPEKNQMVGFIGVYSWEEPVIRRMEEGSAAANSGLKVGDTIISFNNQPVEKALDISMALDKLPTQVPVVVERAGTELTYLLDLEYDKKGNTDLGLDFSKTYHSVRMGLGEALASGISQSMEIVEYTIKGFATLFSGVKQDLQDTFAGPIRIIKIVGEVTFFGLKISAADGISSFFRLICTLSVVVAFMNLLPLPALDGGQIVLSVYMAVRKNKITMKFLYRYQLIGFFIVFLLLTIALFSDIFYVIG